MFCKCPCATYSCAPQHLYHTINISLETCPPVLTTHVTFASLRQGWQCGSNILLRSCKRVHVQQKFRCAATAVRFALVCMQTKLMLQSQGLSSDAACHLLKKPICRAYQSGDLLDFKVCSDACFIHRRVHWRCLDSHRSRCCAADNEP